MLSAAAAVAVALAVLAAVLVTGPQGRGSDLANAAAAVAAASVVGAPDVVNTLTVKKQKQTK